MNGDQPISHIVTDYPPSRSNISLTDDRSTTVQKTRDSNSGFFLLPTADGSGYFACTALSSCIIDWPDDDEEEEQVPRK